MIINKFRQFRQDHILIFGQFTSAAAAAAAESSSCTFRYDSVYQEIQWGAAAAVVDRNQPSHVQLIHSSR